MNLNVGTKIVIFIELTPEYIRFFIGIAYLCKQKVWIPIRYL